MNSQGSALKKADKHVAQHIDDEETMAIAVPSDGTNACTFLAIAIVDRCCLSNSVSTDVLKAEIEDIISSLPQELSKYRNIDLFYDVSDAYDILNKAGLLKNKFSFKDTYNDSYL